MTTTSSTVDPRRGSAAAERDALLRTLLGVLATTHEHAFAQAVRLIGSAPGVCSVVLEVLPEWDGTRGQSLAYPQQPIPLPHGVPAAGSGSAAAPAELVTLRFELGDERAVGTFTVTWDGSPPPESVDWCRSVGDLLCIAVSRYRLEALLLDTQRFELADEIGAGLVHDFNNLLTGIIGYASVARARLTPDHPAATALGKLEDVAASGGELARTLLGFVHGADGDVGPLDPNAVVRATHRVASRAIRDAVGIHLDLAPDLPPIAGSRTLIQQAVLNLVANAAEAIEGPGEIVIRTRLVRDLPANLVGVGQPDAQYVAIAVRDSGPGIPAELADRVFHPFFTTKGARGTGLGLTAVARVALRHDGAVHLAPGGAEAGRGATFTIYLPVAAPRAQSTGQIPVASGA